MLGPLLPAIGSQALQQKSGQPSNPESHGSAHVLDLLHFKKLPVRAPVVLGTQRRLPPPVVRGNKLYHKRLVSASTRAPAMPTVKPTLWVAGAGADSGGDGPWPSPRLKLRLLPAPAGVSGG